MSSWVHLDVELIVKETDAAFLLLLKERDETVWIPKGQIESPDDYDEGDRDCTVSITEWIARQKGLT